HYYALFLTANEPQKRMQRGVFYTPRPVVNYIERGVDEILRTEFAVPLGLADTMTWAELAARNDKITIPEHVDPNAPFVQILDPATGTGTFLVEVIDLIHKRMMEHWKAQKWSEAEIQRRWNEYVPRHLLPRLSGFELMMAPYAIAHMKIGLKLVETGYRFGSDERAHVFLTNALEPAHDLTGELQFIAAALAHEAAAANTAKTGASFTVVIGNPPYAGYLGERTRGTTTKRNLWGSQAYDGVREEYFLRLPKAMQRPHVMNNLADDFVAFFHLCQRLLRPHGAGQIVGLITNRSYLAGESFLAMRSSLIDQFDQCLIIDLGGDSRSPSKSEIDENVFDIQTGVAISIWYTTAHREAENPRRYKALPGERKAKYTALLEANKSAGSPFDGWKTGTHRLTPISQNTFWDWPRLKDLFGVCSPGVKSHRDSLVIGETKSVLKRKIARFVSLADRNKIVETFGSSHHRSADVAHAASFDESMIVPIKYRQFDYRWIYYHPSYVELPRPILRNAFFDPDHAQIRNIALVTLNKGHGEGAGCCVAECLPDMHLFRGSYGGTAFPLWRHDRVFDQHRQVSNLSRSVVKGLAKRWGHVEDSEVFAYIVAVLGSAAYTKQYSSDLKDEEVRIPFTVSRELASYLIDLGNKIIALSTQSDGLLAQEEAQEEALAQGRCDRGASWAENAVHLGSGGVIPGVLLEVWNYSCSGYPVVRNWIAKRHGVPLTGDELGRLRILLNSILELTQIVRAVDGCVREVLGGEILTASDLND
ncbi:MAG: type ISP restriction/modification enzyme, partial [Hyphomicrobiaceae bacterium]